MRTPKRDLFASRAIVLFFSTSLGFTLTPVLWADTAPPGLDLGADFGDEAIRAMANINEDFSRDLTVLLRERDALITRVIRTSLERRVVELERKLTERDSAIASLEARLSPAVEVPLLPPNEIADEVGPAPKDEPRKKENKPEALAAAEAPSQEVSESDVSSTSSGDESQLTVSEESPSPSIANTTPSGAPTSPTEDSPENSEDQVASAPEVESTSEASTAPARPAVVATKEAISRNDKLETEEPPIASEKNAEATSDEPSSDGTPSNKAPAAPEDAVAATDSTQEPNEKGVDIDQNASTEVPGAAIVPVNSAQERPAKTESAAVTEPEGESAEADVPPAGTSEDNATDTTNPIEAAHPAEPASDREASPEATGLPSSAESLDNLPNQDKTADATQPVRSESIDQEEPTKTESAAVTEPEGEATLRTKS